MIRPPPLQLKYDNRFPMPMKTPSKQKSASFAAQLYKANWKNAIIAIAGLNGLRYAFATYNAIVDAAIDDEEAFDNLFKVSIALAVIYVLAFFIEVYGIISVVAQRLSLIRGYLYLTFLTSLLVIAAGTLRGVSYFLFAEEIVFECASLAMQGRGYEKSLFRSRPWPNSIFRLRKLEARKHCAFAWIHQSWTQVASVFIFALIPAVIYYLLVYTYYCQTTDANHPANLQHNAPSSSRPTRPSRRDTRRVAPLPARAGAGGYGYSRVAGSEADTDAVLDMAVGLTTSRLHPAPAVSRPTRPTGPPPPAKKPYHSTDLKDPNPFATKGIKRGRRPPPLVPSPSPLGIGFASSSGGALRTVSPGPPAYVRGPVGPLGNNLRLGGGVGGSRVYAAFAAPVDVDVMDDGVEYDKFV